MNKELWEILVPASNNKDQQFSYEHHKEWDAFVKKITGGVTIMKTAKGEWVSPNGKVYVDRMIPCRIVCTEEQMSEIIDFTIEHYNQEAVLAYRISTNVILRYKPDLSVPKKPLSRIVTEGTIGTCPICHSTEVKEYNFIIFSIGKKIGCINPECSNYYKKKI